MAEARLNGGCAFNELRRGNQKNYACDYTVEIHNSTCNFEDAKRKILTHIDDCIDKLQMPSDRIVKMFYIGKAHVRRKKKRGDGYISIDPQRNSTYKKDGIYERWYEHSKQNYGRDGMVVLTIITEHAIPTAAKSTCKHQEDYAFALEQTLLHHFMITSPDGRIANDGFATGRSDERASAAYAIYMAFRMEASESNNSNSNNSNSSQMETNGEDRNLPQKETDKDDNSLSQTENDEGDLEPSTPTSTAHTSTPLRRDYHAHSAKPHTEHCKTKIQFSDPLINGHRESEGENAQENGTQVVIPGGGHRGAPCVTTFPSHANHANQLTQRSRVNLDSRDGGTQSSTSAFLDQSFSTMAATTCTSSSKQHTTRQNASFESCANEAVCLHSHISNSSSGKVFSSPSSGQERERGKTVGHGIEHHNQKVSREVEPGK